MDTRSVAEMATMTLNAATHPSSSDDELTVDGVVYTVTEFYQTSGTNRIYFAGIRSAAHAPWTDIADELKIGSTSLDIGYAFLSQGQNRPLTWRLRWSGDPGLDDVLGGDSLTDGTSISVTLISGDLPPPPLTCEEGEEVADGVCVPIPPPPPPTCEEGEEVVNGVCVTPPPPPPPVTDLAQVLGVGVAPGNAQLVVTWTAVDTATGYTVQWMSGSQGYNAGDRQATVTSGSTTRYTIPSLINGTAYTVRVIATRTGVTDGPPSAEMTGTPRVPPPPPPPPVTDLAQVLGVGVAPGNAQLVVTWTAVDTATGYTVQWMSGSQGYNAGDRQATVTSGSTTRYTIPSLINGTAYTVRVIATRTGVTDGPPSAEMTGTPAVPTREPEPEPEPEPVPALPLLGQLLLALGLAGAGAMRLVRAARRP